ncbi:MAG: VWA domain-containing protein [Acidobacteria bacterium]|nr:VWA domain-containing protein [Acidobacteriota bacterium]
MNRRLVALLGASLIVLASPLLAQSGLLVPASSGVPDPKVLSLREMSIDAGIARGFVRVNVKQVYENHTALIQEGIWRFQLPPSGLVGDFAVWDGLVRIPGVILEKRRARAIYKELTTQRIDPGLLQQGEEEDTEPSGSGRPADRPSGGAGFSVRVAPIPAWGTKRLEMQYQYEVPWVDGSGEFRLAIRPREGDGMVAGTLDVRVVLLDGEFLPFSKNSLELSVKGNEASFSGRNVKLARDVIVRFKPKVPSGMTFSAFRNPAGSLPDGLSLAPWERPADVPPEKDGFFLVEYFPSKGGSTVARAQGKAPEEKRDPISVAILFDTSLSHRWAGLESGYNFLSRVLDSLKGDDRFALVPFDLDPASGVSLARLSPESRNQALTALRARELGPGTDFAKALKAAAALLGSSPNARILVITDGYGLAKNLKDAAGRLPVYSILTGEERREAFTVASEQSLHLASASEADETLFLRELVAPARTTQKAAPKAVSAEVPVVTSGAANPRVRDVYPVMKQPPAPGSLSGWVGRYEAPAASVTVSLREIPDQKTVTSFPESALEARDLPRRWAKARVDHLLALIELEGEKREWVEEIIELSRRYKFVTPYTAFLAAPRSLLRPRRIQPGDPVIRVEAEEGTRAVTALLPFGKALTLTRRPGTQLWEGRFLVPEGTKDGPMSVRLLLRDVSGKTITETKRVVIDGTPPSIRPDPPRSILPGRPAVVAARADSDVIFLSVRLGSGPPVPLRWNPETKRSEAEILVPPSAASVEELFFEASDGAGNHGFARTRVEVLQ